MSMRLYSTDDGHVPAWEYLPADALTPIAGMAIAADENGKMIASLTPTHICMRSEDGALTEETYIPAVKISPDQVWETELFKNATSAKVGMKVDLDPSAKWVDATSTTNCNFLITYLEGTTMGSVVRGRFV